MQQQLIDVLKSSLPEEELSSNYYRSCEVYVISSDNNCYHLSKNTIIDFTIASVAIVKIEKQNDRNVLNLSMFYEL